MDKRLNIIITLFAGYYPKYKDIYAEHGLKKETRIEFIKAALRFSLVKKMNFIFPVSIMVAVYYSYLNNISIIGSIGVFIVSLSIYTLILMFSLSINNKNTDINVYVLNTIVNLMDKLNKKELNKQEKELYSKLEDIYMDITVGGFTDKY